jgi:PAS domain S-box-containing protein
MILAVDDDPQALELLVELLEQEGYRVQASAGGELALLSAAAQPPDLIMLDVRMPEMDGFEVCRRLKAGEPCRRVPVIFISDSQNGTEWAEALSLGAVDFVAKPFQREELLARVRTHMELGGLKANLEGLVSQKTIGLTYAIEQLKLEIAERRHAEQALRESEERFKHIANAAPVIIWTSDNQDHVDFRNEHAAQFTGRAMGELAAGGWAEATHPEDRERQRSTIERAMAARERFQFEYRLLRADGKYRDMLDLGTPRFLDDGEFAGYIGIVFDLTDVKTSQEQAFREKNLENLRVLSAGIAHDFNTLIGALFGEVDLALGDMAPDAPGRDNLERIEGISKRAAEIVRLLLAYVGDRSDVAIPEFVDINSVVQEIVPHLKSPTRTNMEFRLNLAPKVPLVRANLLQIRLMILNLIMNAVEALHEERGLVTIGTCGVELCPGCAELEGRQLASGTYVKLEIADNGRGMTEEIQDRAFDPYYTTKLFGRGLGLAAVQGIIRSHQGNIAVRSTPGKGATFEVLLPGKSKIPAADE